MAGRELVLVVDDDDDLREVLALCLEQAGYRVASAADGNEALELVAREVPAVILLDMRMPRMNGWDFASELRARSGSARRTPIVVVSAAEDAARWADEIEADGVVSKPFELPAILAVVARHARPLRE